ncbi:MAG: hypothetical protein V1877_00675 [Candidatus Tagabacteria bacterium]
MNIQDIFKNIYNTKTKEDIFDNLCYLASFLEKENREIFFETYKTKTGEEYKSIKNDYIIEPIPKIFENSLFVQHSKKFLQYSRIHYYSENIPEDIADSGQFINLSLNTAFYLIAYFSDEFIQKNIEFTGKQLNYSIEILKKNLFHEFNISEILKMLEEINFNAKYFFKKTYPVKFYDKDFYLNLTKTRLLIGNYLIDLYVPILLSQGLKKIQIIKRQHRDDFRATKIVNLLGDIIKRNKELKNGLLPNDSKNPFDSEAKKSISSFFIFLKKRNQVK